ncbi:MAG: ABC transporter permease [Vampirovibrio sp.]
MSSSEKSSHPFSIWLTRRVWEGLFTLFCVLTLTFFLLRLMPGNPFDNDKGLSPLVQKALETRFHLNEPMILQYGLYLKGLLRGDLGPSLTQEGRSVLEMLKESLPTSFSLGVFALSLGVPLGVSAALWGHQSQTASLSVFLNAIASLFLASPSFLIAGFLILVFSVYLGILPAATLTTPLHWILPVITLAIVPYTFTYLLLKQSLADESSALYLQMKQAAGIPASQILFRHLLRNAWLPLLSLAGPLVANVMTGSFAIEVLYAIPGLGRQFVSAIINRDYTVVMGSTLLYASLLLIVNLLADAAIVALDPRHREGH